MTVQLKAEGNFQQIILEYLKTINIPALIYKINTCGKTLSQCEAYIKEQARKRAKSGCAVIEDQEVFGWAVHFFEEDEIKANAIKGKENVKIKTAATKEKEPKEAAVLQKNELIGQLSLF